jgi:hypothetical protein
MNVDTGHLIQLKEGELPPKGYVMLPEHHMEEAMRELDGRKEVIVNLHTNSPLATFAEQERNRRSHKAQKSVQKRKSTKQARRANRT